MKTITTILTTISLAALASGGLLACGDNEERPDARIQDADLTDGNTFPPAPVVGTQIDRLGRPAINTALNALLEANAITKAAKKDAYNQAATPATWASTQLGATAGNTVIAEFSANLAILDVLDQGTGLTNDGCGNALAYTTPTSATSYNGLAGVLADDQLYVDTSQTVCSRYLAVEFNAVLSAGLTDCGGRTLTHDVIDTSYSLLAAGQYGFDGSLNPIVNDGVSAHTDVNNATFPFLGAPN